MFASVLSNLIDFVKKSYDNEVTEVPTAALMTGINMPDHAVQFAAFAKKLKAEVTPHVVYLQSQDAVNIKLLVESLVNQLINDSSYSTDEEVSSFF